MSQHEPRADVLAARPRTNPSSSEHPKMVERRLSAACHAHNDRLTGAFLRVASYLPRDPEPRMAWVNRRRASNPLACPSLNIVQLAQRAMLDAILTGDRTIREETALAIDALGEELKAAMLAPYQAWANGEPSAIDAGMIASKETSEALHALTVALGTRSPGDYERAIKEANEATAALKPFCEAARFAASRPTSSTNSTSRTSSRTSSSRRPLSAVR